MSSIIDDGRVAGGMSTPGREPGGEGMTLAERSARSGLGARDEQPRRSPAPQARHCWVVDAPVSPGRWPGVLLEWRRGTRGGQGRAVWVADDDDGPVLLQSWVDAAHLATAATETP
jgi:hypothetical protein